MARRDSQSHAGRAQAVARRLRETARGNVRGRAGEAQVGGGEGLRMADAARVWAICSRSHGEAQVDGERVCDGQTRQERRRAVFGRAGKRRSARERGQQMGGCGKGAGKPFSVARGKRRSEGVGLQMGGRGKSAGKAVFGRAGKRRSAGERGLRMADAARVRMSRSRSRPGSVTAIGIVGKTGSANAGKGMRGGQGKPLPGSGLCGGRGWGKNAWAGALRLRDRKNRAREGCPPAAPHI